jgi:hypothetical protein
MIQATKNIQKKLTNKNWGVKGEIDRENGDLR